MEEQSIVRGVIVTIVGVMTLGIGIGFIILPIGIYLIVKVKKHNAILMQSLPKLEGDNTIQYQHYLDVIEALKEKGYEVRDGISTNKTKGNSVITRNGLEYAMLIYNNPPGALASIAKFASDADFSDIYVAQKMVETLSEQFHYYYETFVAEHRNYEMPDYYSQRLLDYCPDDSLVYAVVFGNPEPNDDVFLEWLNIRKIVIDVLD